MYTAFKRTLTERHLVKNECGNETLIKGRACAAVCYKGQVRYMYGCRGVARKYGGEGGKGDALMSIVGLHASITIFRVFFL